MGDLMKATFFQRISAYFIDILIVSVLFSLVTYNINLDKRNDLNEELSNFLLETKDVQSYNEEQAQKLLDLQYEIEKESILVNGISLVVTIGYFVLFQYLNNGQTIGKKLLKLKIVGEDNKKVGLLKMLFRSIIIYGILTGLLNLMLINLLGKNSYLEVYSILTMIQSIFVIISILFILYRKDKRGLHDVMARTNVICERG